MRVLLQMAAIGFAANMLLGRQQQQVPLLKSQAQMAGLKGCNRIKGLLSLICVAVVCVCCCNLCVIDSFMMLLRCVV